VTLTCLGDIDGLAGYFPDPEENRGDGGESKVSTGLPRSWSNVAMTNHSIVTRLFGLARQLWSKFAPLPARVEAIQVVADLCSRSRRELLVENAILRHQLNVLRRSSGRPRLGLRDRLRLLLGAALLPAWRKAIVIVQPETILRWHRRGYRLFWRHCSKSRNRPRLNPETIDLIRDPISEPSVSLFRCCALCALGG
jgi:hypothetical protein